MTHAGGTADRKMRALCRSLLKICWPQSNEQQRVEMSRQLRNRYGMRVAFVDVESVTASSQYGLVPSIVP